MILKDDFRPLDLESSLGDISDIEGDESEDFEISLQDLKRIKWLMM